MESIGSYEAKTHLPRLLKKVQDGQSITITKHGSPIAMLVPYKKTDPDKIKAVIEEMKRERKKHKLGEISIRQLVEEGRKY
jgi:prevent-host-death family protein